MVSPAHLGIAIYGGEKWHRLRFHELYRRSSFIATVDTLPFRKAPKQGADRECPGFVAANEIR